MVLVAAAEHFVDERFMAQVECFEFSLPAARFGMRGVAFFVVDVDVPQAVKFSVFAEQVLSAQNAWRNVPDAHDGSEGI